MTSTGFRSERMKGQSFYSTFSKDSISSRIRYSFIKYYRPECHTVFVLQIWQWILIRNKFINWVLLYKICKVGSMIQRKINQVFTVSPMIPCRGPDQIWKEQVEPVFASHGLTCRMRERDCIMILETGDTEDEVLIERAVLALGVLTSGLTPEWVEPILLGQIYSESIMIEKPDEMSKEEFSSNFDDFINKFDNEYKLHNKWYCFVIYFEKGITVMATSSQATSAVKSLVRDSFFGTIPFQDKAEMLTRDIETYNQKHGILTNNLRLFCSLLDGISDDAICENEETHRMTDIQNSRLKALKV